MVNAVPAPSAAEPVSCTNCRGNLRRQMSEVTEIFAAGTHPVLALEKK